jgi:hypothetical protein
MHHAQAACKSGILLEGGEVVRQAEICAVVRDYLGMTPYSGVNYRVDSGMVVFEGISNRADLDEALPNDDLEFRLRFRSGAAPLDNIMVDFALHNDRNDYAVHSKSRLVDFRFTVSGRQEFEIIYQVKSPRLAPGKYTLTVYIYDRHSVLLWVDNIDACNIKPKPYFGVPELFDGVYSVLLPEFSIRAERVC